MPKRYRIILAVGTCLAAFLAAYFAATPSAPTDAPQVEFEERDMSGEGETTPEAGDPVDDEAEPRRPPVLVESEPPALPPGFRLHRVQRGETMQSIALKTYGDESEWVRIAHENPFEDPLKLIAGTELRLPPIDHERPGNPAEVENLPQAPIIHVVRRNETLGHIAVRYYGKASKWELIFQANRDKLSSPDMVRAGMKLTIPPDFEDQ